MTTAGSPDGLIGRNAVDPQGNKIGSVGQVYVNDQTGQPDWITINTGLFGMKENFAPLAGSSFTGDDLVLPFDKTVVKDSPDIADASYLDADTQQALSAYYQQYAGRGGVPGGDRETTDNTRGDAGYQQGAGLPTTAPTTDEAMTRTQEPPRVGTQPVDADRAMLRKYVVNEQQSVQVPVSGQGGRPAAAETGSPGTREEQLSRLDQLERDIAAERDRLNNPERESGGRRSPQHGVQEQAGRVSEVDLPSLETKVTESQREAWSLGYQAGISGGKATANPFHPLRQK